MDSRIMLNELFLQLFLSRRFSVRQGFLIQNNPSSQEPECRHPSSLGLARTDAEYFLFASNICVCRIPRPRFSLSGLADQDRIGPGCCIYPLTQLLQFSIFCVALDQIGVLFQLNLVSSDHGRTPFTAFLHVMQPRLRLSYCPKRSLH